MPECDGFDVLELLGKDLPPAIIFTTAYDQYALRAFEAGALDYLLKPFDDARFALALERARQKIALSRDAPTRLERLAIKSAGQIVFIKLSDIDWIEAADYYARLHVGPRTHMLRRSIVDLEQDLDPAAFCRIHRSTIINLDRVSGLKVAEDGGYDVVLHNNTKLRLSRNYRKQLEDRLGIRAPLE
jgi:two-component system LytT family response regulator